MSLAWCKHHVHKKSCHSEKKVLSYRCVAKKQCFAPAALYRPFGEQAAGVRSLSQFQALQDGEKELASLRELGLTDTEIQLWQSRDAPQAAEKVELLETERRSSVPGSACGDFAGSPHVFSSFIDAFRSHGLKSPDISSPSAALHALKWKTKTNM